MTYVNVPGADTAAYINEQKSEIQNDIATVLNQTGGTVTVTAVPTPAQISASALILANPAAPTSWQMPNLASILPSGCSTVVRIRNISANAITLNAASGATVFASGTQYPNTMDNSTNVTRTFVAVQSGAETNYYIVA